MSIPRTLLKNGKRAKGFVSSQSKPHSDENLFTIYLQELLPHTVQVAVQHTQCVSGPNLDNSRLPSAEFISNQLIGRELATLRADLDI